MLPAKRPSSGYSMVELLVVLAIVGIVTLVGVTMIGDKKANSVRAVMDEIEGVLLNAQKTSQMTSLDIYMATTGHWTDGTLVLDGRALNSATITAPPAALVTADWKAGTDANRLGSPTECFRSLYKSTINRDHQSAGVDCGDGWYATARGSASDLSTVDPVKSNAVLLDAMGTRLFTGGDSYAILNGTTHRFETGFSIVVVGLNAGAPVAGGAVGVIIVPKNSSSVYKFYKPSNSVTWRRL